MLFGLPGFIQEAALTALLGSDAPERRIRELCTSRRDMLIEGLAGAPGIRCAVPDAGMFTLIDVRDTGLSGYDFMSGLFRSERVSVLDGGAFGEATRGFVRLCFATDEATLREAMVRIGRYVGTLAK
jgi:arginine:pyruvate transaminase